MAKSLIFMLLLASAAAWPGRAAAEQADLAEFFDEPARIFDLPKPLLLAVAKTESDFKPWTLNIEGRACFLSSREAALKQAESAQAAGKSFDLGLMQINSHWLDRYGISAEAALDPLANILFGSWILKQEFRRTGDLTAAVGAYHSPSSVKANKYARTVMAALAKGAVPESPSVKAEEAHPEPAESAEPEKSEKPEISPNRSPILTAGPSAVLVSASTMKISANTQTMKVFQKKPISK
jgi:hypothetical protein